MRAKVHPRGVRSFLKDNVLEAAKNRIRWLFDEFENLYVSISGGKDSTVLVELSLMIAEEKGRLPLPVMFVDQEAEWDSTIDMIKHTMYDKRVEPHWLQVPVKLFNATSETDDWLHCWDPAEEENWIHPKDPISIKDNTFGTDRFVKLMDAYVSQRHPNDPAVILTGMRADESHARYVSLTGRATYKGETWGRVIKKKQPHVTMSPIYDWRYQDIWKAIHDHNWKYSRLYDWQYQHGVGLKDMRVSNIHHETAVKNLFNVQEMEPQLWDRVTKRLKGIATAGQMQEDYETPKALPSAFKDWLEYRNYLLDNLITIPENHAKFKLQFERLDATFQHTRHADRMARACIGALLVNDYHGTKLNSFKLDYYERTTPRT